MRLDALLNGVVTGILCGLLLFSATLWLVVKGGLVVGPHLSLLGQFFPGYRVSVGGAFLGLGYGFAVGFCFAWCASRLYNAIITLLGPLRSGS
jgi:hypothetical protein